MKFLFSLLISIAALLPIANEVCAQDKLQVTGDIIAGANVQNPPEDRLRPVDINFGNTLAFGGGLDIRYFRNTGHGLIARGDVTTSMFDEGFSLYTGTVGYGYRIKFGNPEKRVKKNLDLLAGIRGGYSRATDEFLSCFLFCTDGQTRIDAIDRMSGGVLGPTAGADLGFDIKRFTIGIGTSYSPLFGLSAGQPTVHHSIEGRLKIGINFDL